MIIYSPSRVETYDTCQLRGVLDRQGWMPKEAGNNLLGIIAGDAFASGVAHLHLNHPIEQALEASQLAYKTRLDEYLAAGVSFPQDMLRLQSQVQDSLRKYATLNPLKGWKVQEVELELTEYGKSRLDLVGIDPEGYPSIADNKYKRSKVKLDYLDQTVSEYRYSHQFMQYPWALAEWIKTHPEKGLQPPQRIWLILVIADPFKVLTFPFPIDYTLQARWLESTQQKWADVYALEHGQRTPTMATKHRDQYGWCPYKRACLELGLDESLMSFEYLKIERKSS